MAEKLWTAVLVAITIAMGTLLWLAFQAPPVFHTACGGCA